MLLRSHKVLMYQGLWGPSSTRTISLLHRSVALFSCPSKTHGDWKSLSPIQGLWGPSFTRTTNVPTRPKCNSLFMPLRPMLLRSPQVLIYQGLWGTYSTRTMSLRHRSVALLLCPSGDPCCLEVLRKRGSSTQSGCSPQMQGTAEEYLSRARCCGRPIPWYSSLDQLKIKESIISI